MSIIVKQVDADYEGDAVVAFITATPKNWSYRRGGYQAGFVLPEPILALFLGLAVFLYLNVVVVAGLPHKKQVLSFTEPSFSFGYDNGKYRADPIRQVAPPLKRRVVIALVGVFVWCLSWSASLRREAWGYIGLIALACGLFLLCMTDYESTWNWWL